MSNIYIRSQNKEKLYCFGISFNALEYTTQQDYKRPRKVSAEQTQDTVTRHTICIADGCLEELGEYATKERCLEILDEIQQMIVSSIKFPGTSLIGHHRLGMTYYPTFEVSAPQVNQEEVSL